jgi:hypothetical protein
MLREEEKANKKPKEGAAIQEGEEKQQLVRLREKLKRNKRCRLVQQKQRRWMRLGVLPEAESRQEECPSSMKKTVSGALPVCRPISTPTHTVHCTFRTAVEQCKSI